jgi:hypothetical protein
MNLIRIYVQALQMVKEHILLAIFSWMVPRMIL